MSASARSVGTLEVALAHASRLLAVRPADAAEQAAEILKVVPRQPQALLILGLAHAKREDLDKSIDALRCAVSVDPDLVDAWLALAQQMRRRGNVDEANSAWGNYLDAAGRHPRLHGAAAALGNGRIPEAEALLRLHLTQHPNDVAALQMLADVAVYLLRFGDALRLLERCLAIAPCFDAARYTFATVLNEQCKPDLAMEQCARLLAKKPDDLDYLCLQANILAGSGKYTESITAYESVLRHQPELPKVWVNYGHTLRTAGRAQESIKAYRRALSIKPTFGQAWWSLANLKTLRLSPADILLLREGLSRGDLTEEERLHFEFALGKALEDAASYEESFVHYAAGNALSQRRQSYNPEETSSFIKGSKQLFTKEFFAERIGEGSNRRDPIFIVGLPRSGSTLLEHILASHSLVEGTMELPELAKIVCELTEIGLHSGERQDETFFKAIASLTAERIRALGARYLAETRVMRRTNAPFFIDKMPTNWLGIGLIHLILPNATIIDARRHPLGCCLSCFKQRFPRGQWYTYSLADLGRYYRDYVELMAHFDHVLPGRITRVYYEAMIANPEEEIRRLLEHCGLPFEPACLRFFENDRAVLTSSSEQVRLPIYQSAAEHWRHYEPWLEPLKQALGDVLTCYPSIPAFPSV